MKKLIYFTIAVTILTESCKNKVIPERTIFNEEFNWTITIPKDFENINAEEWAKVQNKGAEAIEKTYNQEIKDRPNTIFVFKNDKFNSFESNYQLYDTLVDGNYFETFKSLNEIIYQTFISQMPGTTIDTISSTEIIDSLMFLKNKMKIVYPNNMTLNVLTYNRLFGNKDLSVNIMYVNEDKGKQMIDSWKNSKFGKR